MTINEIRKAYRASERDRKAIDSTTKQLVECLKEIYVDDFANMYNWLYNMPKDDNIMALNSICRHYEKELNKEMVVRMDIVADLVSKVCDIDEKQAYKSVYRCIYANTINKYEKQEVNNTRVGQRGVVYVTSYRNVVYVY